VTGTTKFNLPLITTSPPDSMNPSPLNWNDLFTKVDAQVGAVTCTSGARPGSPYDGKLIYETDTHLYRIWSATDSAWILLNGNPLGLVAKNSTLTTIINTTIGTEAMINTLSFKSFFNRYYRFHFEGHIDQTTNSTNLQSTIRARWADGSASVTTANTLSDSIFCDPLNLTASPTGIDVKANFSFDTVQKCSTTGGTSTIGVSFLNAGSIGSSGVVAGGVTLITVEDMGMGTLA
jgi:hypothetical protein